VLWEAVFMLVILKIPVVYLCAVVWWAIRAEPRPFEGAAKLAPLDRPPDCDWRRRTRDRRVPPRSGLTRVRAQRAAQARATLRGAHR
jgi:hypothetical protein